MIPTFVHAEDGVSDTQIELVQIAPMKGSSAEFLGTQMRVGMEAALMGIVIKGEDGKEKNIKITSYNDGYEQEQTAKITTNVMKEKKAFAIVGAVGTPTGRTLMFNAKKENLPVVGLFTGGVDFRSAEQPHVINLRASYKQEVQKMMDFVKKQNLLDNVAVFMQEDAFGVAGLNCVQAALTKEKKAPISIATFKRNSTEVDEGLSHLTLKKPKVIVIVGPYSSVAAAIQKIRKDKKYTDIKDTLIMTLSFVGSDALLEKLNESQIDGKNIFITQVVPNPTDTEKPIVREFQQSVQKFCQDPKNAEFCIAKNPINWVSMEGFLVGKIIHAGLEKTLQKGELSHEKFLLETKNLKGDLGGFVLNYDQFQLSQYVELTTIQNGQFVDVAVDGN